MRTISVSKYACNLPNETVCNSELLPKIFLEHEITVQRRYNHNICFILSVRRRGIYKTFSNEHKHYGVFYTKETLFNYFHISSQVRLGKCEVRFLLAQTEICKGQLDPTNVLIMATLTETIRIPGLILM